MTRFEDEDEAFSRRRRRGNSPSSYRVGIGGGSSRRWDDSPTGRDVPREGVGGGGFRPMNGPPPALGRVDFQQMGPRDGGSFQPMGFPSDGSVRGFWPMTPSGVLGAEGMREMDGAGAGGAFRPRGPVSFPPLSPDVGGFSGGMGFQATAGKAVESDYSVRPTLPPVQQPLSGQKRGLPFSEYGSSTGTDVSDRSSVVKLFVGSVPRTAKEEEVRPLFEQHGNVLEVALIKDKRTGLQQGCCFVKYATSEDADRAIRALHNQITLPGGTGPVQVRYADGERERIGALEFKLFVGSLSRQATEKEVEEIFLQFGRVEDVYLMRDDSRQSRGCGFVKYSSKEAAMAAINGLNGTYTMRGCNQPLIVRFAEPKRPKPGEPRDVAPPVGLASGPRFQAPGPRPLNIGDPSGDVSHTNPWPTTSSPNVGPPSNPESRVIGSDFTSRQGQAALPSNQGGPLGGYGVPPLNPLPVPGISSSDTSKQQNPAAGQQISPLYKPSRHTPHNIPPRPQTNLPGSQAAFNQAASMHNPYGYSSQLPTSQLAPQQNITPATAPQTPLNINLRPTPVSSATDQLPPRAQPLQKMQHPPSQLAQLLSQQTQTLQATFQSSQQAFSQLQQQLQSMQQPNQHVSVPQNGQAGKQQWTGSATPTVVSTTRSTPVGDGTSAASVSVVSQNIGSVRCHWTEHTSPDGFKYYYNGLTGESKWEKPEEMLVFERQQQQQQQQPTIKQPQTQLQLPLNSQPMQQQPQQVHQLQSQYQGHHQSQLPLNSQPNQQQPQQVHQFQSQQPFYSSLYPTPGISQNSQYPSMAVGQSSQDYGQAHIQAGAASMNDLSRTQQGRHSTQDLSWRNKQSGS